MKRKRKALRMLLLVVAVCLVCLPLLRLGLHRMDLVRYPKKYQEIIEKWAAEYELDPHILYAVVRTESGFDPDAVSDAGARGLMQITEETFAWIKLKCAPYEEIAFDDLFDPDVNVRFGAYFISRSLERYGGDLSTAAAAYHSGWGTVDRLLEEGYSADGVTLNGYPYPQMNFYVYKINRSYDKYTQLYGE